MCRSLPKQRVQQKTMGFWENRATGFKLISALWEGVGKIQSPGNLEACKRVQKWLQADRSYCCDNFLLVILVYYHSLLPAHNAKKNVLFCFLFHSYQIFETSPRNEADTTNTHWPLHLALVDRVGTHVPSWPPCAVVRRPLEAISRPLPVHFHRVGGVRIQTQAVRLSSRGSSLMSSHSPWTDILTTKIKLGISCCKVYLLVWTDAFIHYNKKNTIPWNIQFHVQGLRKDIEFAG